MDSSPLGYIPEGGGKWDVLLDLGAGRLSSPKLLLTIQRDGSEVGTV